MNVEWTEFCEIDQMKKMNVRNFVLFCFVFNAIPSTQLTRKSNSMATSQFSNYSTYRYISYRCVLEMYGKKSISTLPNRKLVKCTEIRSSRDLISGEI